MQTRATTTTLIAGALLSLALVLASAAQAQTAPAATSQDPLTVTSVIIDKTAANAVVAREEAMGDARRSAFRKLAERNMPPEAATDLALPDDATLATLVQDIEIRREKLSATRYVGDFTVRFREGVRRFIPVAGADNGMAAGTVTTTTETTVTAYNNPSMGATGRLALAGPVLVLPYMQTISGQMVLWGEPNPWREVWQKTPPRASRVLAGSDAGAAEGKVIVPLGDISDISAGPDTGVWRGDYSALEKMRQNYNAEAVILAVANRSGPQVRVDLYAFQSGGLSRRGQVMPVTDMSASDGDIYAQAASETLRAILTTPAQAQGAVVPPTATTVVVPQGLPVSPHGVVESISRDLTSTVGQTPVAAVPPSIDQGPVIVQGSGVIMPQQNQTGMSHVQNVTGISQVPALMQFGDFTTWMEAQKRISGIVPRVGVDIQSITRNQARFQLTFQGNVHTLTTLLAEKGLRLSSAGAAGYQLTLTQ